MTKLRLLLAATALLVLVAAGCGGGNDEVPADAVAVVGDQQIARSDFENLLERAKKTYEQQKRPFPKQGTTEWNTLKNQAVTALVQQAEFQQKADDLGIEVSDKEIDARVKQIQQQFFGGDRKKYEQQLKQLGLTEEQVRKDVRSQIVQEKIYEKVTNDVKVTDEEIKAYYDKNKAQYGTPESRDVRHILVAVCAKGAPKSADCMSDPKAKALANTLYDRLESGGNFAALAKKFSDDPGSKDTGGKLTVARGQTVAPFDQTAFLLGQGKISRPVKTQYGYHIIQPLSKVKPAKKTPLTQVKEQIRQQLLQTKKNEAMTKWVNGVKKDFKDKVSYQVGFAPPSASRDQTSSTRTGS